MWTWNKMNTSVKEGCPSLAGPRDGCRGDGSSELRRARLLHLYGFSPSHQLRSPRLGGWWHWEWRQRRRRSLPATCLLPPKIWLSLSPDSQPNVSWESSALVEIIWVPILVAVLSLFTWDFLSLDILSSWSLWSFQTSFCLGTL